MEVQNRPVNEVSPYWRNPRNNEPAVEKVIESIQQFGFQQPIVVDADGVIIAGHTRYLAVRRLGWETVPVVVADLNDDDAKAYRVADNKTAEWSTWDYTALLSELRELDPDHMQVFFEEDLSSWLEDDVGGGYAETTDDDVARSQRRADSAHSGMSEGDHVEVFCPHCGEAFDVSRADVERRTTG